MDEIENPGGDAPGISEEVLADDSDNTASVESRQGDFDVRKLEAVNVTVRRSYPRSRLELIARNTFASIYGADDTGPWEEWDIGCYDIVPDRARTDQAIGSVEMRERLFLTLVYIAESLIGGPPFHNVKNTIKYRYKSLLAGSYPDGWGNRINLKLVKQLIQETLENGKKGGSGGCR